MEARAQARVAQPWSLFGDSVLVGSPDTIRKRLPDFEAAGIQELILGFPDVLQLDSLRLFARAFIA